MNAAQKRAKNRIRGLKAAETRKRNKEAAALTQPEQANGKDEERHIAYLFGRIEREMEAYAHANGISRRFVAQRLSDLFLDSSSR